MLQKLDTMRYRKKGTLEHFSALPSVFAYKTTAMKTGEQKTNAMGNYGSGRSERDDRK